MDQHHSAEHGHHFIPPLRPIPCTPNTKFIRCLFCLGSSHLEGLLTSEKHPIGSHQAGALMDSGSAHGQERVRGHRHPQDLMRKSFWLCYGCERGRVQLGLTVLRWKNVLSILDSQRGVTNPPCFSVLHFFVDRESWRIEQEGDYKAQQRYN